MEGEKELFTIRIDTEEALPPELRDAARHAWSTFAHYTHDALGRVAQTLDLPSESLTKFSDASLALGPKPQATMMRLFRYECNKPKLVSERRFAFPVQLCLALILVF